MLSQEEGCHRMGGRDCGGGGAASSGRTPCREESGSTRPCCFEVWRGPGWTGREVDGKRGRPKLSLARVPTRHP